MGFIPNLPDYLSWTKFTPAIPKIYLNAKSLEQWAKEIFCEIHKITEYLKLIANTFNSFNDEFIRYKDKTDKKLELLQQQIDDLQIENRPDTSIIYDPTQGKYMPSKEAMRNIFRELTIFGRRVDDFKNNTVLENSKHTTIEHSVIGHYTIDGDTTPRVTPVGGINERDTI